jgi:tetratricopeptide (TPR) repeat protein
MAVLFLSGGTNVVAQTDDSAELRTRAESLYSKDKYIEALPLFKVLVNGSPKDGDLRFYYGFCLIAKAQTLTDKKAAKQYRVLARKELVTAKELGSQINIIDGLIDSIPADGSIPPKFSKNEAAEELMTAGENEFFNGNHDAALANYKKALDLDPTIYAAALFSGDMYFRKNDFDSAEVWYQKAITIDPNIETAYRYSATPLMRQKKYAEALERYIESYITQPYSKLAVSGLTGWSEATETSVGHPRVTIPVKFDEKGNSNIALDPKGNDTDVWLSYTATRVRWRESEFAKTYPGETDYRHSLKEEAAALRSVIEVLKDKKTENLTFKNLVEIEKSGYLEAFILLALADNGIAADHQKYLTENRAKLRGYVRDFVVEKKQ